MNKKNRIFFSLIVFFFTSPLFGDELQKDDIKYTFKHAIHNCLNVKAEFLGNDSGNTVIETPWDSYYHLGKEKFKVNVIGGAKLENNSKYQHNPNAKFTVTYDICSNELSDNTHFPVISNGFFSFYSNNVLLYPKADMQKKFNITFDFSSLPKKNKVFSSFGENRIFTIKKNISELLFSQFVGGDIEPSIIKVKNKKIYLIEHGKWSFFENKKANAYIRDLIAYQRYSMQDFDFPRYLITLIRQSDKVAFKMVDGIHTKNSVVLTFPDGPANKFHKVLYMISHELFHNWIGSKIEIPEGIRKEYRWFFEGFTDYMALTMVRDSKLISSQQYADILNLHIKDYYTSELHTISNALYTRLNTRNDINFNFIQTRGHLLAILFSELLQKKGLSENTIKTFIKDLVLSSSKTENKLTPELFWTTFNRYFDKDFKELVETHILEGKEIRLPPLQGFYITKKETSVLEPGFDIIESTSAGKIININKNSPAYQAGIDDGATFLRYNTLYEQDGKPRLVITISEDQKVRHIEYNPKLIKKEIPWYAVNDTAIEKLS